MRCMPVPFPFGCVGMMMWVHERRGLGAINDQEERHAPCMQGPVLLEPVVGPRVPHTRREPSQCDMSCCGVWLVLRALRSGLRLTIRLGDLW